MCSPTLSRWRLVAAVSCLVALTANAQDPATTPAFKEVESIQARVQGCVTCHGNDGQGTRNGYYPRIAGKPAGYLYNQLVGFRDGTRKYPPMNYLVAYLPDAYLHEIAAYFADQRPPYVAQEPVQADATVLAHGKALVTAGDTRTGVPACTACHGDDLTGMQPGIPGLVGLRPNYVVGQLTRWRVGDRHAAEPDCMARVAARLADPDISAIAAWLSTLPPPKNPSPLAAQPQRMPLACGNQGAK